MKGELEIFNIILSSGPVVQLVLISLIIASIISWAIVLKKKKLYKAVKKQNDDFLKIYQEADNLKSVMEQSEEIAFSPFREMFREGYMELSKIKSSIEKTGDKKSLEQHFKSFGIGVLERSLKKGVNISNLKLTQDLGTLASIGSISPFVGLFGTVWGIINSFQGLAGGGGTIEAVAPGIAEALVATAVGLAAAIPAVWFYNNFSKKNMEAQKEMENFGQEFLNVVERSLFVGKAD